MKSNDQYHLRLEDFIDFSKKLSMQSLVYKKYKDSWLYIAYLSFAFSVILFISGGILISSVTNFILGVLLVICSGVLFSFSTKYNRKKIEWVISGSKEYKCFLDQKGNLNKQTLSRIRTHELSKFIGDKKVDILFMIEQLEKRFFRNKSGGIPFGILTVSLGVIGSSYFQDIFRGSPDERNVILKSLLTLTVLLFILTFFLQILINECINLKNSGIKRLINHLEDLHQMRQQQQISNFI